MDMFLIYTSVNVLPSKESRNRDFPWKFQIIDKKKQIPFFHNWAICFTNHKEAANLNTFYRHSTSEITLFQLKWAKFKIIQYREIINSSFREKKKNWLMVHQISFFQKINKWNKIYKPETKSYILCLLYYAENKLFLCIFDDLLHRQMLFTLTLFILYINFIKNKNL